VGREKPGLSKSGEGIGDSKTYEGGLDDEQRQEVRKRG